MILFHKKTNDMKKSNAIYIVDGIRTPIGKFQGALSTIRPDDLMALTIKALIERNPNIDPDTIGDVIIGCANQAGEDNRNVARMATLLAGLPFTIPGETINRLCASGMSAINNGVRAINNEDASIIIAGGVESMTRAPWVISKSAKPFGTDAQMFDSSFGWRFINPQLQAIYGTDPMGLTAENLAEKYQISREEQDVFANWSQQKASRAAQSGRFAKEIVPVEITIKKGQTQIFDTDEFIKADTTLEILEGLRPAFKKDGTVTAGNASGLNDGAACVFIASEEAVKKYNLIPLARVVSSGVAGVEPKIMGIGPVNASKIALQKAGLKLNDISIIEINEAFSAQVLACTKAMGLANDDIRINPNGGAIALGHPLGMSGTRIVHTAALSLKESNQKYALCTMCVGVGQGYAMIIESI
jgi:acetyl-CoA acyltransferase